MRRIVVAATVVALMGIAQLAFALGGPVCCACVPAGGAQTSGFFNGTIIAATFCAQAPPANPAALALACNATLDHSLECIPDIGTESCISELTMAGVSCPSAGAPAAGSSTLLTLTIVLAAGGVLAVRRRRA